MGSDAGGWVAGIRSARVDARPSDPFLPMLLGFVLAIVLIAAAFFHETLLRWLAALAAASARALRPVVRAARAGLASLRPHDRPEPPGRSAARPSRGGRPTE